MIAQILAYLVIIGITVGLETTIICIADEWIKKNKIIYDILGIILIVLGMLGVIFTTVVTVKCLLFCCSIIS